MRHPRTTIAGYLILGASVLSLVARFMGGNLDAGAIQEFLGALAGAGLVSASDGGH